MDFQQRARHAEAQATAAPTDVQRQVLITVAAMWREIALEAARAGRARRRRRREA